MKQTNTAKRPAIFVTLNDCKLVSCDRQLLSCDRKLISCDRKLVSCDRKLVSCDRKLISCDRKLVSCDRKLISCDRKLVSCDRKLVTCDEKNRCVPYEPPSYQTKCQKEEKIQPVAVPLDTLPERRTMTIHHEISARGSLTPVGDGSKLLSDTCPPGTRQ